jgi:hypothetical protein
MLRMIKVLRCNTSMLYAYNEEEDVVVVVVVVVMNILG